MARTMRRDTDDVEAMPVPESTAATSTPVESIGSAISRRAFELYCARGRQHGYDVEDWLYAEREVRYETGSNEG